MKSKDKPCFNCGVAGDEFMGYIICPKCKKKLGLFTDKKIMHYIEEYESTKEHTFEEEILRRLDVLDKEFIKKRIKLLHILSRFRVDDPDL